jgi:hypothetical protein
MSFLAPLGLAALIGVPLIILFHMRHSTPIERPVPTLRFWLAAEPTRSDDSRFKLPPLSLLLVLQLLAVGLLGLALARPAVSDALAGIAQRTEPRHLVIMLDGSTSMSAVDTESGVTRYEAARDEAVHQLDDLREGDTATVMVLGSQVHTMQASDSAEISELAAQLSTWDLPGGIADLNAALRLVVDLDVPGVREDILLLSDGAMSADPAIVDELNAAVTLERFGQGESQNLAITKVESRPAADNLARSDLYVQVANFSEQPQSTTLLVAADGFEVARQDIQIDANAAQDVEITTLPEDASDVVIEVRSSDSLFADNQASLTLNQETGFSLRILLVSDTLSPLQRALSAMRGASVATVSSAETLQGEIPAGPYDLVVYDGASPTLGDVPDIPMLIVNPPRDGMITTLGMITIPTVERVRANDPVLREVDLAGVIFRETPVHELDASAVEIVGAEEGPLIYRARAPESGQPMIVITFDVQQSNLPKRIAFPTLIANIVWELSPNPLPSTVPLGDPVTYTPRDSAEMVRVTNPAGTVIELPVEHQGATVATDGETELTSPAESREVTFTATGFSGVYSLTELNASGQEMASATFVVNAGHPQESNLRADPELPAVLSAATASSNAGSGVTLSDLWPVLAAIALGCLLFEWLWSTAPWRRSVGTRDSRRAAGVQ